jgi:hypothetical protein
MEPFEPPKQVTLLDVTALHVADDGDVRVIVFVSEHPEASLYVIV